MLELEKSKATPCTSRASAPLRRRLRRELASAAALLGVFTGLVAACGSDSPSRAEDDDGGIGGRSGSAGRGGNGGTGGSAGTDQCGECVTEQCAAETGACVANSACQQIADCYGNCEDDACATECDETYPGGVPDWYALLTCSAQNCADPCEFQGSGGTGGVGASCVPPTENGACDNFPRVCGCSAAQNCIFDTATEETVCAAQGTTAAHSRCTAETCERFHGCVGGTNRSGTCRPYCDSDDDCGSTPFNRCIQVTDSDDQAIDGFKVCTQHCNLSDPRNSAGNPSFGACGAGANCVLSDSAEGTAICFGMSQPLPAVCENHGDCALGYGCNVAGTCQKWCRVGSNVDCAATPTTPVCGGFTTRLLILAGADGGKSEYGFCVARTDGGTGPTPDAGPSVPPPP